MKRKFIIFNDVHLKPGNEDEILVSIQHMLDYGRSIGVDQYVCAGDFFDSRSFQRLKVLTTFYKILEMFHSNGVLLIIFPGNHDKAKYESEESFIEPFQSHPAMIYINQPDIMVIEGHTVAILPFFHDGMLIDMIKNLPPAEILISHFEMNGSVSLGRVSEHRAISPSMLDKFDRVFLGHFHDYHRVSDGIYHLPSFRQNNFGEDVNKGFTVINEDGSHEIIQGVFKRFKKVNIDLDAMTTKEIDSLLKTHQNSENAVRFSFTGSESKLKALKKGKFIEAGIDVEIKYQFDFDADNVILPTADELKVTQKHTEQSIHTLFENFCKENKLKYKEGVILLNNFLNKK